MVRFQLVCNEKYFLREEDLCKCETILDIKKLVFKIKKLEPAIQVISFENAMLPDNFKLSQLGQPTLPPTGEPRPSMPLDSLTTLMLTVAQGKCILNVNLFLGNNTHQIELVIPSSLTVASLQDLIIRTVQRLDLPKNAMLMLSYNKQELAKHEFIFQSLFENRPPQLLDIKSNGPALVRPPAMRAFVAAE